MLIWRNLGLKYVGVQDRAFKLCPGMNNRIEGTGKTVCVWEFQNNLLHHTDCIRSGAICTWFNMI